MAPFRTTAVIPLYPCFRFLVIIALYLFIPSRFHRCPIAHNNPLASSVAEISNYKTAKWLSGFSSYDIFFDGINDVFYIIIADVWACRQTHTNLE